MDNIYQAVKEFIKSIINLFVAVINLFAGVFDGIAFVLGKLRPRVSFWGEAFQEKRASSRSDEELVKQIRSELQEKVTSQDKYYYYCAKLEHNGNEFYMLILAFFVVVLGISAMLYSARPSMEMGVLIAAFMVVACVAAYIAVEKHQKKMLHNRIARLILEEEFKDIEWGKIHPIMEVIREENVVVERKG